MKRPIAVIMACGFVLQAALCGVLAAGPLRVCKENPRYFADDSGKAIYLTGAHTWNSLQDFGPSDARQKFDFDAYLEFLEKHHHNFIRLWRWELVKWDTAANNQKKPQVLTAFPHPWARSGSGVALDGQPKFDLDRFDDAYFDRLRLRVTAANQRGIYVGIMLFEGWGMQFVADAWRAHPFHPSNNVNAVTRHLSPDAKGLGIYTLKQPDITRLQEAYVRKVIDTVNGLDNVLFEISNENHPDSTDWQYHIIRLVQAYEKGLPQQHPVGMTFQYRGGTNATLFASPADWISPNPGPEGIATLVAKLSSSIFDYRGNPPPADGRKVVLSDTDHLWGIGGDVQWVWKTFLRGHNTLFMDPYEGEVLAKGSKDQWEPVRSAMGRTRRLAQRIDLNRMKPRPELASTHYCLATLGAEYLVYQPKSAEAFTVDLPAGTYTFEWLDVASDRVSAKARVQTSGRLQEFVPPGENVLHLRRE